MALKCLKKDAEINSSDEKMSFTPPSLPHKPTTLATAAAVYVGFIIIN